MPSDTVIDYFTNIFFSKRKDTTTTVGTGGRIPTARVQKSFTIDEFFSATKPILDKITDKGPFGFFKRSIGGGALSGVKAILQLVGAAYARTAGIASPMFRFALADWAIGLLTQAQADIQSIISDEVLKKSEAGQEAVTLEGIVKNLAGEAKEFQTDHQNTIKDNKSLGKSLDEPAKGQIS